MAFLSVKFDLPMVKEPKGDNITAPEKIAEICRDLQKLGQEAFQILTLNSRNKMIDRHLITLGLVDACLIRPREVFRSALLDDAAAIILVHNHPSGDPQPSEADIKITREMVAAGKIIGVKVLDHVIIGATHYSIREGGLVAFN